MLLTPFSADAQDERTQNFVKSYQEEFGDTPNQFAADAYDAVYILKAALEAAECTPDMSSTDICEAVVAVMPTLSVDGLTGVGMTWDASGAVSKKPHGRGHRKRHLRCSDSVPIPASPAARAGGSFCLPAFPRGVSSWRKSGWKAPAPAAFFCCALPPVSGLFSHVN